MFVTDFHHSVTIAFSSIDTACLDANCRYTSLWTPVDPFSGVKGPGLCGEGALAVGEEVNVDGAGVEAVHSEGAACFKSAGGGCFEGKPGDNLYFEKNLPIFLRTNCPKMVRNLAKHGEMGCSVSLSHCKGPNDQFHIFPCRFVLCLTDHMNE